MKQDILRSFMYLAKRKGFDWETLNCMSWSSMIIKALHGIDLYEKYKHRCSSRRDFLKGLIEEDVKSLTELVSKDLGEPSPARLAQVGDPVILEYNGEECMGIYFGNSRAFFLTQEGLTDRHLEFCKCCWRL